MKIKDVITYSRELLFYGELKYSMVYMVVDIASQIMKMMMSFVMIKIMINGLIHLPLVAGDDKEYLNVFQMFLPFVVLLVIVYMAYSKFIEHKKVYWRYLVSVITSSPLSIFLMILLLNGLSIPSISIQYMDELYMVGIPFLVSIIIRMVLKMILQKKNQNFKR